MTIEEQLEIKHIKMIKTIAETKNLTKAAKKLFLTQPALSHQLIGIEKKMNTVFFHRTKKRMIPSKAGEKVLIAVDSILDQIRDLELEISKMVHGESGDLKVGVQCMFSYKWLPSVLQKFHVKYPKIQISISNSYNIIKDLKKNVFDVVITAFPIQHNLIEWQRLMEDDIVAITSLDHLLTGKKYLIEKDFQGVDLISVEDEDTFDFFKNHLLSNNITPRSIMTIKQPEAILELVKAGLGVSFFPKWAVESYDNEKKISMSPLTKQGFKLEWKVAVLKDPDKPVFVNEFVKQMVSEAPLST